jgi:hypothetical protein
MSIHTQSGLWITLTRNHQPTWVEGSLAWGIWERTCVKPLSQVYLPYDHHTPPDKYFHNFFLTPDGVYLSWWATRSSHG